MSDLETKLAVTAFTEFFKEALHGVRKFGELVAAKDWLGIAARRYAESAERRYDSMRIFGMTRPMRLGKIYTKVNVLEKIQRNRLISVSELEELSDLKQRRFGKIEETKPGLEVINEYDRVIVLGKPGSGKTTFLKYLVLESLNSHLRRPYIPIFISLHEVSSSPNNSIFDSIVGEFDLAGIEYARDFATGLLEAGKCILLLDGLDEVRPDQTYDIINQIVKLSDRYFENKFVVSCRVAVYHNSFEKFVDVEMSDFGTEEIRSFVTNWFSNETDEKDGAKALARADECFSIISQNPQLLELASTPLLLTILCLAHEEGVALSQNRVQLYDDALDALLRRWDGSRHVKRDEIYKHMTLHRKRALLAFAAAEMFDNQEYFVPISRLEAIVASFIEKFPEVDKAKIAEEALGIVDAVEAHHGILVERAKGIHSFSHLTFQEFFAAKYVSGSVESQSNLIDQHLDDSEWREVIIAVATLLSSADNYVLCILEKMVSLGFSKDFLQFLKAHLGQMAANQKSVRQNARRSSFSYGTPETIQTAINAVGRRRERIAANEGFSSRLEESVATTLEITASNFISNGVPKYVALDPKLGVSPDSKEAKEIYKKISDDLRTRIEKINIDDALSVNDYVEKCTAQLRAACESRKVGFSADRVGSDLKRTVLGILVTKGKLIERDLRLIGIAETLIAILEAPVDMTEATRQTAIRTITAGWR